MQRVVVLGRGGAGKSTTAAQLGAITGLPVLELDAAFWSPELVALSRTEWTRVQRELAARLKWIMDGDLGPYDVLEPRLTRADTVLVLDFSLVRCVWNAARRSRERPDFWWWVLTWRVRHRPALRRSIARHAQGAEVIVLRGPRAVRAFLDSIDREGRSGAQDAADTE